VSTVSVVPTVDAASTPPRVQLAVTDTGTPNLFTTTVTRLNPDGSTSVVRTPDGNPLALVTSGANRVGSMYDYEAPYGAAVSYSTQESPGTVSAEVTVPASKAWLVHPSVPSISTQITIASLSERQSKVQRGVYYPMGRRSPVVQSDGQRKAAEYTLGVYTATDTDRAAIVGLLEDAAVLLLNVPADLGWGIGAEYIAIGDVTETRPVPFLGNPDRIFSLPVTVVDAPVGGTTAARTYSDLLNFSTYAALNAAYPTYAALLAGP
jgi:hypothetical protein